MDGKPIAVFHDGEPFALELTDKVKTGLWHQLEVIGLGQRAGCRMQTSVMVPSPGTRLHVGAEPTLSIFIQNADGATDPVTMLIDAPRCSHQESGNADGLHVI